MVRFFPRVLSGSEIRSIRAQIREAGGLREVRTSVLRGDSIQNINKIIKKSGVTLNNSQVKSYISGSYALTTFVNYIAKAQAKNNIRNGLGLSQLIRDGYRGIARITVQGFDKNGKVVFRNVDASIAKYDSIGDLLNDVQADLDETLFDSLDITKDYHIVSFKYV